MSKLIGQSTTIFDLSSDHPKPISGEFVEMIDSPPECHGHVDLLPTVKMDYDRRLDTSPIAIRPETLPLENYEAPLTYEIMHEHYGKLYSADSDGWLISTIPGSPEHEAARQQAKKEITAKFLHKMGLPSDYMRHLDIDRQDTREILHELYFEIPEDIDRDNSLNGFFDRVSVVHPHITETSTHPDIREKLDTIIEIWLADYDERAQILRHFVGKTAIEPIVVEREAYLQQLLKGEGHTHNLIQLIGNCLIQADQAEVIAFQERLSCHSANSPEIAHRLKLLRNNISEFHIKDTAT